MGGIAQPFHQLGFQGRGHAVLQLVGFDVRLVKFHAQELHHQPFGEAVPTGDAFAFLGAAVGQADPLVVADFDQALFFHAPQHAGDRWHGRAEPFGGRQLAEGFRQPGQRGDLRVLPHLVEGQEVVFSYGRQAIRSVRRLSLSVGVGPGFARTCHVNSQHEWRIVLRLYPNGTGFARPWILSGCYSVLAAVSRQCVDSLNSSVRLARWCW